MNAHVEGLAAPRSEPAIIGAQAQTALSPKSESVTPLFGLVRDEPLVEQGWVAPSAPASRDPYSDALQRHLDVIIASAALLVLWPVMVIAAVLVFLSSPGPIFYSHPRFGRDGKVFGCLKFRTMRCNSDLLLHALLNNSPALNAEWQVARKLRKDPRTTAITRFLRRYSIDELPQIFNVLRGDMSIVGPRPLATDEVHFYAGRFPIYCSMRPGITGLWTVSGRNEVTFLRRVDLDCEYARIRSLRSDIWIILRTVPVVFRGTGF
ncbi:MAG: sugar transferase [Sphingomicrobium sp.]